MSQFIQALTSGYTPTQILNFLSHTQPKLAPSLNQAKKYGYSPAKILNFLTNLVSGGEKVRGGSEAHQSLLQGERAAEKLKDVAGLALTAGGLYAANKALPAVAQGVKGVLGTTGQQPQAIPQGPPAQTGPQGPIGPQPMANAPVRPASPPPVGPAPIQGTPSVPPVSPQQQKATEFFKSLGVEEKIKQMVLEGKTPEQISAEIQTGMHPSTRKSYQIKRMKGEERPVADYVKDYIAGPNGLLREDILSFEKPKSAEPQRPQKGDLVFDESAGKTGQLESIRHKEALLSEEGKLHKVSSDKLLVSETPEKDLADLYEDLIRGIEKETQQEVSRNVEFAGYDPEHNELVYRPHAGGVYVYDNIPPEDVELLTNLMTQRKTSGKNFIGAWEQGTTSPIGAAMYQLIKRLQEQRGGKGKEYSRKFQTIYSAHEPAQLAAKKKKAEEERRRKK